MMFVCLFEPYIQVRIETKPKWTSASKNSVTRGPSPLPPPIMKLFGRQEYHNSPNNHTLSISIYLIKRSEIYSPPSPF
jgi:hypothetical protein